MKIPFALGGILELHENIWRPPKQVNRPSEERGRSKGEKKKKTSKVFATLKNLNIKHRKFRTVGVGGVETQHNDFVF